MKIKYCLYLFIIPIILLSCKKDSNPEWNIDVISPLLISHLDIFDIVPDSLLEFNNDNSINIVYKKNLVSISLDSWINLSDTITNSLYKIPFNGNLPPGLMFVNDTTEEIFDFDDAEITEIEIKSGFISFNFVNTIKEDLIFTYSIPYATNNGMMLKIVEKIPAATSIITNYTKDVDLSGYHIDMAGINGNNPNSLVTVIKAQVDPDGDSVYITTNDYFKIYAKFKELKLQSVKGFLGSKDFNTGDKSTDFDFFNYIKSGKINFDSVHLSIDVINGLGIDAKMTINHFRSINTKNNNIIESNASIIGSTININRAIETNTVSNPVTPSIIELQFDNSNIKEMLENLPDLFEYSIDISSNPLGNISLGHDFIYSENNLEANLNLKIPLSIIAKNLTLSDTSDFSFSQNEQMSHLNKGTFKLIAENAFPFEAELQIYLFDHNNILLDSLLGNTHIDAALLDNDNKVIESVYTVILSEIDENKIEKMTRARKSVLVIRFNTTVMNQYIKIYKENYINIRLTGDFNK